MRIRHRLHPFYGTPFAIPGTFEAEDFDRGGEGVAYHDNRPRQRRRSIPAGEDVDIIASSIPPAAPMSSTTSRPASG